jgi:hypothetical protein
MNRKIDKAAMQTGAACSKKKGLASQRVDK